MTSTSMIGRTVLGGLMLAMLSAPLAARADQATTEVTTLDEAATYQAKADDARADAARMAAIAGWAYNNGYERDIALAYSYDAEAAAARTLACNGGVQP